MNDVITKHGYFFDLDGTLVNTHESNTRAYLQAIYEVLPGSEVSRELLRSHIAAGENYRTFLPHVLPRITDSQMTEVSAHKAACYPDYIPLATVNEHLITQAWHWKASPEAVMVLVTTAKEANAERVLAHFGLDELFDFKVFGDGVKRLKPAPDIYLKALQIANLDANQVEAFEDSQAGLDAAQAAGIAVTHVVWAASQ